MRNERRAFGSSFFMLFFLLGDRTRNPFKLRNKLLVTTTIVVAVLRKMKTHSSSTTAFSQTYSMVSFPVFQRTYHCFAAVPPCSPWHVSAAPRWCVRRPYFYPPRQTSGLPVAFARCKIIPHWNLPSLRPCRAAMVRVWAPFLQICNA
jgi:hypothetical protein